MVKDRTNAEEGEEHSYQRCQQQLGVRIPEGGDKGHLKWEG